MPKAGICGPSILLLHRCTPEQFDGGENGVGVYGHGVFHPNRVPPGQRHHDGNASRARGPENQLIPLLQPLNPQNQSAKLVYSIGIGAGHVSNQVGLKLAQPGAEGIVEPREIFVVSAAVGQVYVDR